MKKIAFLIPLFFFTLFQITQAQTIRYVDSSRSVTTGNGTSWGQAYKTLNAALDEAAAGSANYEIRIAKGTYYPTDGSDRNLAFSILRGGIKLYGGYASGGSYRNIGTQSTILSGEIGASNTINDNSYHVLIIAGLVASEDSVILDGLQVSWGHANGGGSATYNGKTISRSKGGGLYLSGNANNNKVYIRNCIISGNRTSDAGAGMCIESSSPFINGCLFSGNYADYGGAVINGSSSSPIYLNCTIAGNHDNHGGGAMRNSSSDPGIINCIIYGNDGGISNNSSDPTIRYSLVQGLTATTYGNLNGNTTNPLFVSPVAAGTVNVGGDYRLQNNSPCINKGDNSLYVFLGGSILDDKDLWGNPRVWNTTINMGANEEYFITPDANGRIYVKKESSGPGSSWANAIPELSDALLEAKTNTNIKEIWVAGGVFYPSYLPYDGSLGINTGKNNNYAFVLVPNVKLYGGFAGNETNLSQRNLSLTANKTTLSGDLDGSNSFNNNDAYHVVIGSGEVGTAELNGFTIKGGYNTGQLNTSTITVNGNQILRDRGAGMVMVSCSPLISNVILSGNKGEAGAAISLTNSNPTLLNILVEGNTSEYAAIHNNNSSPTIINSTIAGNNGTPTNVNGVGIRSINNSTPKIYNSIIWGNKRSNQTPDNVVIVSSTPVYTNSIVQGSGSGWGNYGTNGGGNLDVDPKFQSSSDYRLKAESPAINYGQNSFFTGLDINTKDVSGNPRVYNFSSSGVIDMGAYEYQGNPTFPIIYVKSGGTGNGSSWANAIGDLQEAINASGVQQVWVAKGTYQPALNTSFIMKNNISIYGGFNNSGNPGMADRNWKTYVTILKSNGSRVITNSFTSGAPMNSSVEFNGFTISNGSISGNGGGMYNLYASPTLSNLIIIGNLATNGGGIYNENSSPKLFNIRISGNSATSGGGIFNVNSSPNIINVSISSNKATTGGGINNVSSSNPQIRNSIIWRNSSSIINNSSTPVVTNSIVDGGYPGTGNFDFDPIFVNSPNPNSAPFTGGDYTLQSTSPAINIGNNSFYTGLNATTKDLAGNSRVYNYAGSGIIDMGAYEFQGNPSILYVKPGGTGIGNSWTNAKGNLQEAIDADGVQQVWVAKGTYQPSLNSSFVMKNDVAIYGGFDNNGNPSMANRNWSAFPTILKGNGYSVINNNFTNQSPLFSTAILDGFTITEGSAEGGTYAGGGGIFNYAASPTLSNLLIQGNTSGLNGGGMHNRENSNPTITNSIISGNFSAWGGAMANFNSSPVLINVTISGNRCVTAGGALSNYQSYPVIRNSIIYGNSGPQQIRDDYGYTSASNSLIDNVLNNGNINADPLFISAPSYTTAPFTGGDYRVKRNSPVINKGNNSYYSGLNSDTKDINGEPRVYNFNLGGIIDMGAVEFQPIRPDANGIIYVKEGENGKGTSWTDATGDLQGAIITDGVQQVWVAKGSYQPAINNSFVMKTNVAVYGGFNNTGNPLFADRDWVNNTTIMLGNGRSVFTNDLSSQIPLLSTAILDGFTLTQGNGTGNYGGGIYLNSASPTLSNLIIANNSTSNWGGGISLVSSNSILNNVLVNNNSSYFGAGIYNKYSSPTFNNVDVNGNTATFGGGIYNESSIPIFNNCNVKSNTATSGGGFYNNTSAAVLNNVTIRGNTGSNFAGGIYNNSSNAQLTNVLIAGNYANSKGGGINNENSSPTLTNVTIAGNKVSYDGGGMFNVNNSNPIINNTVIFGNSTSLINSDGTSIPVIKNSLVQGLSYPSDGNLPYNADAKFASIPSYTTAPYTGGDFSLLFGSFLINSGNNQFYPNLDANSKDILGNSRVNNFATGSTIDIGAYEYVDINSPIRYVKNGGTGNGSSWANATGDLRAAINADGVQEVWVAKGTYQPLSTTSFAMKNGIAIYGGFNNTGNPAMIDRDWKNNPTILKGNNKSVISNDFTSSNPLLSNAILDGFTVTQGITYDNGGGIYNKYASPKLNNLTISNNTGFLGGGVYNENSSPAFTNVIIKGNNGTGYGGGVYNTSSLPVLINSVIVDNKCQFLGAGIYNSNSSISLTNLTISANFVSASGQGGGIFNSNSSATIQNTVIYGNSSGILSDYTSNVSISYSLVEGNSNEYNGNINGSIDPKFTTDYSLQAGSPLINKGNNSLFAGLNSSTSDIGGNPRVYNYSSDGVIDIGAYEFQGLPIIYVKVGGTGNGSSWANAMGNIQSAIDGPFVQQVWVAKGNYQPVANSSFVLKNNVSVFGGFNDSGNPVFADRNWKENPTILKGNGSRVFNNEFTITDSLFSTAVLDGFTLTQTSVAGNGGAIYNKYASPKLNNLLITGNTANNGGGIYNVNSSPIITNTLIAGNLANNGNGGGMYNDNSSPEINNLTISGNKASEGFGVYNTNTSSPKINNTIIFGNGNSNDGIFSSANSVPVIKYSLVQGLTNTTNGNMDGNTDPLFISMQSFNTAPFTTGDYSLQSGSPVINKGSNALYSGLNASSKDLSGNSRVYNYSNAGIIDMGAFELQVAFPIIYVKVGGTGNGFSWSTATGDLQNAINTPGVEQVWVAKGIYQPPTNSSFVLKNNVAIYGGFNDSGDPVMTDRDWKTNITVLKGNGNRVVTNLFTSSNSMLSSAILDGFTINNGNSGDGGGIYNNYASPTLSNLLISNNIADFGGGIYNIASSSPIISNVIIENNKTYRGGGIYNNLNSAPVLTNVLISGNYANGGGGGIFNSISKPKLNNVTIAGNSGSAIYNSNSSVPTISNSIIYGNSEGIFNENGNSSTIKNSLVQGVADNTNGNINGNTNPLFISMPSFTTAPFAGGNYRLDFSSPCVNAGSNTLYSGLTDTTKDLSGGFRAYNYSTGGVIDMGAYEFQGFPIMYVKEGATGNGSSWDNAIGNLQTAIDGQGVQEVWVAKGNYQPAANSSYVMKNNVAIYGGFNNTGNPVMADRNYSTYKTVLNGNGRVVINNNFLSGAPLTETAVLDGFTVTLGNEFVYGGGIYNKYSSPTLSNLIIKGNESYYGGGIYNDNSSPKITNVLIYGNNARGTGGGIFITNNSNPLIINTTISGNTANNSGEWYNDGNPTVLNSIIYGNGIWNAPNNLKNSLVQGNQNPINGNVIYSGPVTNLFTDVANGDYSLASGSFVINNGNNTHISGLNSNTKDLAGNPRVYNYSSGGIVDLGAYEYQGNSNYPIRYVKVGGTGNGTSWADAMGNFQAAINSNNVEQVYVAEGTYQTVYQLPFTMKNNVAVYGGFANTGNPGMTDRNWKTYPTILRGNGRSVISNYFTEATALNTSAILDGFTVTGGYALVNGGGIDNNYASPTLSNLLVRSNSAKYGGGISNNNSSSPVITNVEVSSNDAMYFGGGISNYASSPVLTNVTVSGNTSQLPGKEWYSENSNPIIRNSIIYGNGTVGVFNNNFNSLVQGYNSNSNGNINYTGSLSGLFVDAANGNYSLIAGSPAINSGNNIYFTVLNANSKDLAGNDRVFNYSLGGLIDIGAYESVVCLTTSITDQPLTIQNICLGSSSEDLQVSAAGDGKTYQWYSDNDNSGFDGVAINDATNSLFTPLVDLSGTSYYYVKVTGSCGNSTSTYATVNVVSLPQVVMTHSNVTIYAGDNITLNAQSGSDIITWSPATGLNTISGNTVIASPLQTTTYIATATNTYGCTSANTTTVNVNAYPPLVVGAAIQGPTNVCLYMGNGSQLATYSIYAEGASGYAWTIPSGAINVTGQGTNTISFNYPLNYTNGDVSVKVSAMDPGEVEITRSINVGRSLSTPTTPIVSGIVNVCNYVGTGVELTYTAANDENASSYVWTVPTTVTIVSGQGTNSINVTFTSGFTSSPNKQIRVISLSGCGQSAMAIYYLKAQLPMTPGFITGSTEVCSYVGTSNSVTYSIADVISASSYMWTLPLGATIVGNSTGTSITVIYDNTFVGGNIIVNAVNSCGTSGARSLSVKRTTPSTPGPINGPRNICMLLPSVANPTGINGVYYVTSSPNNTYTWNVPEGIVIQSQTNTGSQEIITVSFNSNYSGGSIGVYATNDCGTSTERILNLTQLIPGAVGGILQMSAGDCEDRNYVYTVSSMPTNASSLEWTVPVGATIISGQGTTTITVLYPSEAVVGVVSAIGNNGCGNSPVARTISVKLGACEDRPLVKGDIKVSPSRVPLTEHLEVIVYPNPSTTTFILKATSSNLKEVMDVRIIDNLGREFNRIQMKSGETISFGSELKAGSYFVEIKQGKEKIIKKVLKF